MTRALRAGPQVVEPDLSDEPLGAAGVSTLGFGLVLELVELEELEALDDDDSPPDADLPGFSPYASAYQPPPFKMKLPPEIMRRALSLPQAGHFLTGASVMRCSFSKSASQASQW